MIPIVTRDPAHEGDQRKSRVLGWKEARLGLVYAQGSVDPVFGASTAGVDPAGDQLGLCAARIGLDADKRVHAVGDGALWIADQTERVFGAQSDYLVDYYHLCDYLAAASKGCAADHRAWYDTRKRQMKSGQVTAVLAALYPHLEPPRWTTATHRFVLAIATCATAPDSSIIPKPCKRSCQSVPAEIFTAILRRRGLPPRRRRLPR